MNKTFKDMLRLEFGKSVRQIMMIFVLAVICLIFSILTGGTFTSARNLSTLMLQATPVGIAAVSIVLVLVAGHIDLSIGSFVGLTGAIAAKLMVDAKMASLPTIIIVLVCGVVLGAWQGFWIAYRRIPAFIVTLASMQIFRGGALLVSGGVTISPMADAYKALGQEYLPGIFATEAGFNDTALYVGIAVCIVYAFSEIQRVKSRKRYKLEVSKPRFTALKIILICACIMGIFSILASHLGIPIAVVVLAVFAVLFSFISANTAFGRHVYALGGNKEAAVLSGINIKKTTFMIFIIMGVMCSVSSIIYTARINAATLSAGQNMEMDVIAAAIIGGTSTLGGEGSVFGAIIGALIISTIDNGMSIMNLQPEIQFIAKGLILLFAVWLDVSTRKNTAK